MPDRRTICMAGLGSMLSVAASVLCPRRLLAQTPGQPDNAVQVGDWWTFDNKDEITRSPIGTFTLLVTDVSAAEIVARTSTRGKSGYGIFVFDQNWNVKENSRFKWIPDDGQGIQPSLAVGKAWRSTHVQRGLQANFGSKTTVESKVVAQEMLTTQAGDFETFRIESHRKTFDTADPSRFWDRTNVGWFAPQINYWVRRTFLTKAQNRVTEQTSHELIEFGRKLT